MRTFKTWDMAVDEVLPEQEHQIIYYISERLSLEQWIALDEAMDEAFEAAGIDGDKVTGIAGPIPIPQDQQ